ncbi:MAG: ATP-binding protein [Polyangiaceae bacterium]
MVLGSVDLGERLLTQLASLTPGNDLEDSLWALISTFAEGLGDVAVGVCVPRVNAGQLIVRHAPTPREPRAPDPARLFPERDDELILEAAPELGATLHVAVDGPIDSTIRRGADLLAHAVGSVIRQARFQDELRRDAREVHSLRDQAVQSDKLAGLGRMAASIVHELNNPLTSIVAYSDLLRRRFEQLGLEAADRDRLARIAEAASRVLSFTRDLVAYSRPSSADLALLSLHDEIERAIGFCDHLIDESAVIIERRYGELPPIRGLRGPLTQVFVNLITNACQAMRESAGSAARTSGNRLVLETSFDRAREVVVARIIDEGPGIESQAFDRLFEPYFTMNREGGNGLGLSIVRTIVASHGGAVTAANHEPRGAVFTIELPAQTQAS